jgi:hypothetical protein
MNIFPSSGRFALWLASFLSVFLVAAPAAYADFSGSVVSVLDGDTIEVLYKSRAERIRLNGIDCPEKGSSLKQVIESDRTGRCTMQHHRSVFLVTGSLLLGLSGCAGDSMKTSSEPTPTSQIAQSPGETAQPPLGATQEFGTVQPSPGTMLPSTRSEPGSAVPSEPPAAGEVQERAGRDPIETILQNVLPDLIVVGILPPDQPLLISQTEISMIFTIEIENRGEMSAAPFWIAPEYSRPFSDTPGEWYVTELIEHTWGYMPPGQKFARIVHAHFGTWLRGQTIDLRVTVDACTPCPTGSGPALYFGPSCMVHESNELNNKSAPLRISLP